MKDEQRKKQEYNSRYREKNREKMRAINKVFYRNLRLLALQHYSKNKMECACCSEKIVEFLALDHINGGGNIHRKEIKNTNVFQWVKKNKYPIGFQVLCHNCNMAKTLYGICPHQSLVIHR